MPESVGSLSDELEPIPSNHGDNQMHEAPDQWPTDGWYYGESGEHHGPVSLDELRRFLTDGYLEPDTYVYCRVLESWQPAHTIKTLWRPPASQLPSSKWYINEGGQASQGYSADKIWDLIEQGRVTKNTELYSESLGTWKPAQKILIFANAWQNISDQQGPPPPPSSDNEAGPPPVESAQSPERKKCKSMLDQVETSLEQWDCQEARKTLADAGDFQISHEDEELRERISRLQERIADREEEKQEKEKEIADLFAEAESHLEEMRTLPVFETIFTLRDMSVVRHDEDLAGKVDALEERAEETERKMLAQKQDATEALEMAQESINNWNLTQAKMYLEAADDSPACQFDEDLKNRLDSLQSSFEDAQDEFQQKRSAAAGQLDDAEACLEDFELEDASTIINQLEDNLAIRADADLAERHSQLQSRIRSTQHRINTERQEIPEVLEKARAKISEADVESAQILLNEASNSLLADLEQDIASTIDDLRDDLEKKKDEMKKQRAEARKMLANAQRSCAIYDFEATEELLEQLADIPITDKDSKLSKRVAMLRKRLEKQKDDLQKQRTRVRTIVEKMHDAIDQWNAEEAEKLFEQIGNSGLNRIDANIRKEVREAKSSLEELNSRIDEQTERADSLLAEVDEKIKHKNFNTVSDLLDRLEKLQIVAHSSDWDKRIQEKRKEVEQAQSEWEQLHQRTNELFKVARSKLRESNFSRAKDALDTIRELGTPQKAKAVKSRLNHLSMQIEERRKQHAEKLLVKANTILHKNVDAAAEKLKEVQQMEICDENEDLRKKLDSVEHNLSKKREQRRKILQILDKTDDKIQSNDLHSARKMFNNVLQLKGWKKDPELHKRVKQQKENIMDQLKKQKSQSSKTPSSKTSQKTGKKKTVKSSDNDDFSKMTSLDQQKWYYYDGGNKQGPVTLDKLQELASTETINPEDYVWAKSTEVWVEAQTVADLAECFSQNKS